MTPEEFLAIEAHGEVLVFPVDMSVCSGTGSLFGGAASAAVVAAAEAVTGRAAVWTAVQFVRHVRPPASVTLAVDELARGRRASQVRVNGTVDGDEVFTAMVTTGWRPEEGEPIVLAKGPDVPAPEACPPRVLLERHRGSFMARADTRLARAWPEAGRATDGRSSVWTRIPDLEPSAATLAIVADYVPFGVRQALGDGWATHSLDITLRVLTRPASDWVLADVAIDGIAGGFGHGQVHVWDQGGTLLAVASQSFTCRPR